MIIVYVLYSAFSDSSQKFHSSLVISGASSPQIIVVVNIDVAIRQFIAERQHRERKWGTSIFAILLQNLLVIIAMTLERWQNECKSDHSHPYVYQY